MKHEQATSATVTGNGQQVGFRAMVMKHAIQYNLAGTAENEPNEVVRCTLSRRRKTARPCYCGD
jgi:acylphosphatase